MKKPRVFKGIGIGLLLVLALGGALLLDPLVRFSLELRLERFDDAQALYQSRLAPSPRRSAKAMEQLTALAQRTVFAYDGGGLSYAQAAAILDSLLKIAPDQALLCACRHEVESLETARNYRRAADALYAEKKYPEAISLYRRALMADDAVQGQLNQTIFAYKAQMLHEAEQAMAEERFEAAEGILAEARYLLGPDEELETALADVRALTRGKALNDVELEARRRMDAGDAQGALAFVAACRADEPDDYSLLYLEQTLRHEFEAQVLQEARSFQERGDLPAACGALERGLLAVDSSSLRALLQQIRTAIPYLLGEMEILEDDTALGEVQSTVERDLFPQDNAGNAYAHSFCAAQGSVSFDLAGRFSAFTGTVAFPAGEASDLYRASATLQIWGDGRLLGEFKHMDMSSLPRPFSIGVEGIQKITLAWTGEGANGQRNWGRFATVFDGRFLPPAP